MPKERCHKPKVTVAGLKANTSYTFKVKINDDKTGKDGQFTVESDPITTRESPALGVLMKAEKIEQGPPKVYRLPIKENISARNEQAKTRKFSLGNYRLFQTVSTFKRFYYDLIGLTICPFSDFLKINSKTKITGV